STSEIQGLDRVRREPAQIFVREGAALPVKPELRLGFAEHVRKGPAPPRRRALARPVVVAGVFGGRLQTLPDLAPITFDRVCGDELLNPVDGFLGECCGSCPAGAVLEPEDGGGAFAR